MFKRATFLLVLVLACTAARRPPPNLPGQSMMIEAGSGRVVTLTAPAASVFAADPKVVEVRPASPTSLFLFGVATGHTTVAAMSAGGQPIAQFDVTVGPSGYSASATNGQMNASMPGNSMTAGVRNNGLVINGAARTPMDAERAQTIGRANLTSDTQKLDNRTTVNGAVQVNLRVRVVEMSRNITRELGVNWQAMANIGARYGITQFSTATALVTAATSTLSTGFNFGKSVDVNTVIDALAQDQLVHVLAEPNITAMSGEAASFLVGGEFPIPIAQFGDSISIEFKQYGVSLAFVPTVLTSGRISLHVRPEVSELTNQGAITLGSGNNTVQIPALQVRRADTTVELGSGQSFAIAGLMQDSTRLTTDGVPWLGDVPILGALFRSDSFQRNETELVILVTPYLVQPASSPDALSTPDAGWKPPNDLERILLLRQKAHGTAQNVAIRQTVPGDAGFIVQ
ncbi:type II and III secretion system protein family protein [Acidisphaera sp. L21]|uniref:type II and III secretion system protein family protein n=1 Tax=Acidisphaera sp. L21 TaxID=1641851 RepID=UPI00131D37FD|nr:type II and III secretion system protein family protein [Acidisphaera sp. L21]